MKRLINLFSLAVMVFILSISHFGVKSYAEDGKTIMVPVNKNYTSAKFTLTFDYYDDYVVVIKSPSGKEYKGIISSANEVQSVVNDVEVGGYTKRKRMILIGSIKAMGKIIIPDVVLANTKTTGDALKKVTSEWFNYNDITKASAETQRKMSFVRPGHNYKDIPEMANLDRHSNVYRRLSADEPAVTITNWRKVNLMPPEGNRILSVSEAAALMGLDKNFKFLGSINDRQQQVGNGVTQAIASFVKSLIKNYLYKYSNETLGMKLQAA